MAHGRTRRTRIVYAERLCREGFPKVMGDSLHEGRVLRVIVAKYNRFNVRLAVRGSRA